MSRAWRRLAVLALLAGAVALLGTGAKAAPQKPQQAASAPADAKSLAPLRYRDLAPGDRKIVHALFAAQRPTADGPPPLNLDQIAALKARTGWEPAFRRMKAEGLLRAKTLRQVIEAPGRGARALPAPQPEDMAMSTAEGRAVK